jgi:hypothetical protein
MTVAMMSAAAPKRSDAIDVVSTVQAMAGNEGGFGVGDGGRTGEYRQQRPASTIPLERLAHRDNIDGEGAIRAEDLNWNGKDVAQEGHAFGQITAPGKEARERFRRRYYDQVGDVKHAAEPQVGGTCNRCGLPGNTALDQRRR